MNVWIIETGNYEGRYIFGVAESVDAAVATIKAAFAAPYRVRWEEVVIGSEEAQLIGEFEQVPGFSTRHTGLFTMTCYQVNSDRSRALELPVGTQH